MTRRRFGALGALPAVGRAAQRGPEGGVLPNILFLLSDDHSYADLGCFGNSSVRSPNLDRLAAKGVKFDHCFVSSPQCSPNRSSIFTGCTPHSTSTSRLHTPMPAWEPTFLEPLKERGYFTGAVRKVHQGREFEGRLDYYDNKPASFEAFFDRAPQGRPFWFQVGFTDPHRRYYPGAFDPPHDPAKVRVPPFLPDVPEVRTDLGHYYDFIARMDAECGRLFDILERRGLTSNTMVVFTGDNGMPFPRAKGTCYDPGIRVPMIVNWPGHTPAGTVASDLISHVDLPVTWLEAAGIPKPRKMQGVSFLDVLLRRGRGKRQEIFAERNWHDNFDPIRTVRTRTHKLIFNAAPHFPYRPAWDIDDSPSWRAMQALSRRGGLPEELLELFAPARPVVELYDLQDDPNEFHNVAASKAHAPVLGDLTARLSRWMHDTHDFLPPALPAPGEPQGRQWPVSL
jgi:N-sulfoglucosamine sulfohydrolase